MSLTVETGSGVSGAESYASVADADAYWAARNEPAAWTAAETAEKEAALRIATEYLDARFGSRWRGVKADSDNALDWPRAGVHDENGYLLASDELPTALVRATIEAAGRQAASDLDGDVDADSRDIVEESLQAGKVKETIRFAGTKAADPYYTRIERLVARLIWPGGTIRRA